MFNRLLRELPIADREISVEPDLLRLVAGLHVRATKTQLQLFGLPLGELWDLDALVDDCAAAATYDAFFTSAPLNMPGGVATPPNAIAIR